MIYNWILIKKSDGKYLGWSKAESKPPCGEPDKLEWYPWGKELPEDIDIEDNKYIYSKGELVKG